MQTLLLATAATSNLLLLLLLQWYTVAKFGAGSASDAVFASLTLSQFGLNVLTTLLMHVLVPLLALQDEGEFRATTWDLLHNAARWALGFGALAALTAAVWVPWMFPGFDGSTLRTTVTLTQIQAVGLAGGTFTIVAWAAMRARGSFLRAEVSSSLASTFALGFLVWQVPRLHAASAAWAFVIRAALPFIFLLPALGWYRAPRRGSPAVAEAWRRIRPLAAGAGFHKVTVLADRFLASLAPPGGLSILALVQQISSAWEQFVAHTVTMPAVPKLARAGAQDGGREFSRIYRRTLWTVGVLSGGILAVLVLAAPLVTRLGSQANPALGPTLHMAWPLLAALAGQWILSPVLLVISSGFYARGDTRVPALVGSIGVPVGIALRIGGYVLFGLVGLALGISGHYAALLVIYGLYRWRQKWHATRGAV